MLREQRAGASSPRDGQEDPGSGVLMLFLVLFTYTSPSSKRPLEMVLNPAGNGRVRQGRCAGCIGERLLLSVACWLEQRASKGEEKRITELSASTPRLCTGALPAGCESVPGNLRKAGSKDALLEKWD